MSAFTLTQIASLLSTPSRFFAAPIRVGGWLTSARFGKSIGFLVLSDGSSLETLQVVLPKDLLVASPDLRVLGTGCSVRVEGVLVESSGAGQAVEIQATHVEVLGLVEDPCTYPIQPKPQTADFLRTVPHLRSRVAHCAAVARLRGVLSASIREYLEGLGFLWVATPILTATDAEGAGSRFQVVDSVGDETAFFGKPTYLSVSGQLEGEALCQALGRVYTFGPTFRAERSHTSRHLAEFWMVEPEMAFADLSDIIHLAEGMLKHAVSTCLLKLPSEMALFEKEGGRTMSAWRAFVEQDFVRLTYTAAIDRLLEADAAIFATSVVWGMDLQSEHERWLVDQIGRPVVLTDYPASIKAFYMKTSSDGQTVSAMDVLVPGMGELIGGSERESDLSRLDARMTELGMDTALYPAYRDLRRYGSVPHAGFGLGFERLVAYVAGLASIKEAISYPRFQGSITD